MSDRKYSQVNPDFNIVKSNPYKNMSREILIDESKRDDYEFVSDN